LDSKKGGPKPKRRPRGNRKKEGASRDPKTKTWRRPTGRAKWEKEGFQSLQKAAGIVLPRNFQEIFEGVKHLSYVQHNQG